MSAQLDSVVKQKAIIRVKYVDEPENEFQMETNEIENKPLASKMNDLELSEIDLQLIELKNLKNEKEIFLKATLQLLDLKEAFESYTLASTSGNAATNPNKTKRHVAHKQNGNNVHSNNKQHHLFPLSHLKPFASTHNSYDIIRYGTLKKASRANSALGLSSNLTWKTKYVALRHGIFTYDDIPLRDAPVTSNNNHNASWSFNSNGNESNNVSQTVGHHNHHHSSRSILLTSDTITVHFHNNNTHSSSSKQLKQQQVLCNANEYVFELTDQTSGVKRLWMTYSMADCLEWIAAITSACVSAVGCNKDEYSLNAQSGLSQSNSSTEGNNPVASALMSAVASDPHHHQHSNELMEPSLLKKSVAPGSHFQSLFSPSSMHESSGFGHHPHLGGGVGGGVIQGSSSLDDKDHRQDSGVALSRHPHNQSFSHGSSSQHINNQHQMNTVRQQHTSMAGAAAPYAGDITRYLNLRNKVAKIATEDEYKELVRTLIAKNVTITIPIFYIKNKTKAANFNLCSQDNNAHQVQHSTPAAVGRSQMWLDYARDVVMVNNETVSGGVDSVIGALVRHMAEKVDDLKLVLEAIEEKENEILRQREAVESMVGGGSAAEHYMSTSTGSQHTPSPFLRMHSHHAHESVHLDAHGQLAYPGIALSALSTTAASAGLLPPRISLSSANTVMSGGSGEKKVVQYDYENVFSEATMVSTAKDLLMMCNRTQSGGDTYYTIDSLLCASEGNTAAADGMKLCILTPLSSNADPLEFNIDVVHCTRQSDLVLSSPPQSTSNSCGVSPSSKSGPGITRKNSVITRNKSGLYSKENSVGSRPSAYLSSQNNSDSDCANVFPTSHEDFSHLMSEPEGRAQSEAGGSMSSLCDERTGVSMSVSSSRPHSNDRDNTRSTPEQHAHHLARIAALQQNAVHTRNAQIQDPSQSKVTLATKLNHYASLHTIVIDEPFDRPNSQSPSPRGAAIGFNGESSHSLFLTPDSSPMNYITLNSNSAQALLNRSQTMDLKDLPSSHAPPTCGLSILTELNGEKPALVAGSHMSSMLAPNLHPAYSMPSPGSISSEHSTSNSVTSPIGTSHNVMHGGSTNFIGGHKQAFSQPVPLIYQSSTLNNNYSANSRFNKDRPGSLSNKGSKDDTYVPHSARDRDGFSSNALSHPIKRGVTRRSSKTLKDGETDLSKRMSTARNVSTSATNSVASSANSSTEKMVRRGNTPVNVSRVEDSGVWSPSSTAAVDLQHEYSQLLDTDNSNASLGIAGHVSSNIQSDNNNNSKTNGRTSRPATLRRPQLDFRDVLNEEENKVVEEFAQQANPSPDASGATTHPNSFNVDSFYTPEQISLHNSMYSTNYVYSGEKKKNQAVNVSSAIPGTVHTYPQQRGGANGVHNNDDQSVVSELTMDTTLRNTAQNSINNTNNKTPNNNTNNPIMNPAFSRKSSPPLPISLSEPLKVVATQNSDYLSHSYDDAKTLYQLSRINSGGEEEEGESDVDGQTHYGTTGSSNANTPGGGITHKHKTKNIFKFISKKLTPHKQTVANGALFSQQQQQQQQGRNASNSLSSNDLMSPQSEKRRNSDTAAIIQSGSSKYFPSHLFGGSGSVGSGNTIQSQQSAQNQSHGQLPQSQQSSQYMSSSQGHASNTDHFSDLPGVSQATQHISQDQQYQYSGPQHVMGPPISRLPSGGGVPFSSPPPPHTHSAQYPPTTPYVDSHSQHSNHIHFQSLPSPPESQPLGIRITVRALSKYRICTSDPQGYDDEDIWAIVSGVFTQSFYLIPQCNGRLVMSERVVTIKIDSNTSTAIAAPADLMNSENFSGV